MCFRERERKIQSVKAWRALTPVIEGQIGTFTETVYSQVIEPNIVRTSPIYVLQDSRLFARITINSEVVFTFVEESNPQIQGVKWFVS